MKALTMTLVAALTLMATTSQATCLKEYMKNMTRDTNQGNFYTQVAKNNIPASQTTATSKSAPVQSDN